MLPFQQKMNYLMKRMSRQYNQVPINRLHVRKSANGLLRLSTRIQMVKRLETSRVFLWSAHVYQG